MRQNPSYSTTRRRAGHQINNSSTTTSLLAPQQSTIINFDSEPAPPSSESSLFIPKLPSLASNRLKSPTPPPNPSVIHGSSSTSSFNNLISSTANWFVEYTAGEALDTEYDSPVAYAVQPPLPYTFAADEMPCRERTIEFRSTVKSMQMKMMTQHQSTAAKPARKLLADSVQFNQMSKRIGHDMASTCAKLEKLSELARRGRSLFDDRQEEINELTTIIKADIQGLNMQIGKLQQLRHHNEHNHNLQDANHSKSVVVGLQSRLANASQTFKKLLEVRTTVLREQKTRRDQLGGAQKVPYSLPPSASQGVLGSVLLADDLAAAQNSGTSVNIDMSIVEQSRQQQQLLLRDEQASYAQQRSDTMENIEQSINELGTIFKQLATLVQEQGETIQRIDMNVEETSLQVEAAHMELLKYFKNISKNRWLAIKVFGTLIAFFLVFIIFLT